MKKIKPDVIGYKQIIYRGRRIEGLGTVNKLGMQEATSFDKIYAPGHKPKFRPVYKKQNNET